MQGLITVCICTFRRPLLLERLLNELEQQETNGRFIFSIVVADNDAGRSAERIVSGFGERTTIETDYCCEPRQNIALARNRAIEMARGEFIAFVDDDEFPARNWLIQLWKACESFQAAGVLGPVRPHFDQPPPGWIVKGGFCERPEHRTGRTMDWTECRTGNVLFRKDILPRDLPPFDSKFGTGGEDKDFFMRMNSNGRVFIWCNEAIVYETVPPARWRPSYMFRRALLRGKNIIKHPEGRIKLVSQSILAVPLYLLVLPLMFLFGRHHFMKYSIKLCDHAGRLLALFRLNWVNERQM